MTAASASHRPVLMASVRWALCGSSSPTACISRTDAAGGSCSGPRHPGRQACPAVAATKHNDNSMIDYLTEGTQCTAYLSSARHGYGLSRVAGALTLTTISRNVNNSSSTRHWRRSLSTIATTRRTSSSLSAPHFLSPCRQAVPVKSS